MLPFDSSLRRRAASQVGQESRESLDVLASAASAQADSFMRGDPEGLSTVWVTPSGSRPDRVEAQMATRGL
jgi:hypothetical protein